VISSELKNVNNVFKTMTASKNQWERDAGFTQIKNGLKGTTEAADLLKLAMDNILSPFMALTGIAGVSVFANMAAGWGHVAAQIKQTSYETGMANQGIQNWINLGKMFGIQTDDMMSGLKTFSKNMEDTAFGRNNPLMAFLSRPDIGIKDIRARIQAPGGVDSLMREISGKLQNFSPIVRSQMLDTAQLGFMKPMLMYGEDEFNKRKKMAGDLGLIATDKQSEDFLKIERSANGARLAIENYQKSLTLLYAPAAVPVVNLFSKTLSYFNTLVKDAEIINTAIVSSISRQVKPVDLTSKPMEMLGSASDLWNGYKSWRSQYPDYHRGASSFGNKNSDSSGNTPSDFSVALRKSAKDFFGVSPNAMGDVDTTSQSGISLPGSPPPDFSDDSTILGAVGGKNSGGGQGGSPVTVNVYNAQPGTKVTTQGPNGQKVPVNISYSLQNIP
jgi:hypothetical protein